MYRLLAAALLTTGFAASAMAHELTTPPPRLHPLPQGVPTLVVGAQPHQVISLRFGIIHGRRALIDRETGRVVYYLNP